MRNRALAALMVLVVVALLVPARAGDPRGATYSPDNTRIFWFVRVSDTHVGARGTTDSDRLRWILTTAKSVISPSFIVATGDLTDSTNGNLFSIPNGPYQAEWDEYRSIVDPNVSAANYFDLPGNHDAYNDKYFAYYRANAVQGRATGGTQVSWTLDLPFGEYLFLGVNTADNTGASFSLTFPYGDHAGLDTTELAYIEDQLAHHTDARLTMVFGHHPVTDTGVSGDTWLFYGHQDLIQALDANGASLYGYGHTHAYSDVQFTGNSYTGPMTNGGVRYLNVASLAKSSASNYDVIAVDNDGVSSVPATAGTWPVVLITAPVDKTLGTTVNPYAYSVPAASSNPIRALVFDAKTVSSVQFRVDAETTWHSMSRNSGNTRLYEGVWDASALASGDHTITVQATGTTTKSHSITVAVVASNRTPAALADTYATDTDKVLAIAAPGVLANDSDADGDALTAAVAALPAHGTVFLSADGSFTYTPAAGFSGTDGFTYTASDGQAASAPAAVTITVKAQPTGDTVAIQTASYAKRTGTLTVQATSSVQPNATLTVTGYGDMSYNAKKRYYALSVKTSPAPASVTVVSSAGGSATKTVSVK
jgi:hypothetical protein